MTVNKDEEQWEDPYPTKRSIPWFSAVAVAFILYVLSVGPVFRLAQRGSISWKIVETVYAPINLMARFRPIDRFIQWYIIDVWKAVPSSRLIAKSNFRNGGSAVPHRARRE